MNRAGPFLLALRILLASGTVVGSRAVISADDCTGMYHFHDILSEQSVEREGGGFL